MGSKAVKSGKGEAAVFELYSRGLATSRDAYLYHFSASECAENGRLVTEDYMGAMRLSETRGEYTVDEVISKHQAHVRWDRELKNNLRRSNTVSYSSDRVRQTQYRPFVKQHCYVDYVLVQRKGQQDRIFPTPDIENRAICVPGIGSTKPFSALMVDTMPDLELISKGQCFPRYRFERQGDARIATRDLFDDAMSLVRVDNITDHALRTFRAHYDRAEITKDDIFDYVYGVLNAPAYRVRFENNLSKALPRIPFAPDFDAFANAGKQLAALHLGYESCKAWPLKIEFSGKASPEPHHFRLGTKAMRFADDARTELIVNEHIRIKDIPPTAHFYVVNGRTPLEWFIDRYLITRNEHSGIVNDPNHWFEQPQDLVPAIARIVYLSVLSGEIQAFMPEAISDDDPDATKTRTFFAAMRAQAAKAIAKNPGDADDQAFIDSVTDLDWVFDWGQEAPEK